MPKAQPPTQGWQGWDDYADFYDWENAQTLDRRDVTFWTTMAERANGPDSRARVRHGTSHDSAGAHRGEHCWRRSIVGNARSRAEAIATHTFAPAPDLGAGGHPISPLQRFGPIRSRHGTVRNPSIARQGIRSQGHAGIGRACARARRHVRRRPRSRPASVEGYRDKVRFRGVRRGGKSRITLVESVRQDRAKKLTVFDQEFIEQRGRERSSRRFSLVFRTLTVPQMTRRLEDAGFRVKAVLGDYSGEPWDRRADVWLILAEKC